MIYICVYICIYRFTYNNANARIYNMYIHTPEHSSNNLENIYKHTHHKTTNSIRKHDVYVCIGMYIHIYIYIYIHVYTHLYTYVYTHIHKYTGICMHARTQQKQKSPPCLFATEEILQVVFRTGLSMCSHTFFDTININGYYQDLTIHYIGISRF